MRGSRLTVRVRFGIRVVRRRKRKRRCWGRGSRRGPRCHDQTPRKGLERPPIPASGPLHRINLCMLVIPQYASEGPCHDLAVAASRERGHVERGEQIVLVVGKDPECAAGARAADHDDPAGVPRDDDLGDKKELQNCQKWNQFLGSWFSSDQFISSQVVIWSSSDYKHRSTAGRHSMSHGAACGAAHRWKQFP